MCPRGRTQRPFGVVPASRALRPSRARAGLGRPVGFPNRRAGREDRVQNASKLGGSCAQKFALRGRNPKVGSPDRVQNASKLEGNGVN